MATIKFAFEYQDQEYEAKAIKMESKDHLIPVKFHIYGLEPAFGIFKGPVIVTTNRSGQAMTSARYGTIDNFKSAAIMALYKHCRANSINMF